MEQIIFTQQKAPRLSLARCVSVHNPRLSSSSHTYKYNHWAGAPFLHRAPIFTQLFPNSLASPLCSLFAPAVYSREGVVVLRICKQYPRVYWELGKVCFLPSSIILVSTHHLPIQQVHLLLILRWPSEWARLTSTELPHNPGLSISSLP